MAEISLTESDNGSRIAAIVGDTIDIRLAENATTGYRWVLEQTETELLAVADTGSEYPGRALGSGGQAYFRLRVASPGTGSVRLTYRRPWDGDAGDPKRFSVEVSAAPT